MAERLAQHVGEGESLLIIAEDVEGEALATLVVNKMHGLAGLFLTTEAVIAEKPEKEKAPAAPSGGDMDF